MDRIVLQILFLFWLAGCSKGYDPPAEPYAPAPTLTVAELKSLYNGRLLEIREPMVVAGRVTSSDEERNIYHSLSIEQEGEAIELLVSQERLSSIYPTGCRVVLSLEGLALDRRDGVIRVGCTSSLYESIYVEAIAARSILDQHLFRLDDPLVEPEPQLLTLEEVEEERCGAFVRVEQLIHAPEGEEEGILEGTHRFFDAWGRPIYTTVSSYARFSSVKIPQGPLALQGILRRRGSAYEITLRYATDIEPME